MTFLPPSGLRVPIGPGKAFIEAFMVDACVITRDAEGVFDNVLDQDTGLLTRPDGDSSLLYSGKCLFKPLSARGAARSLRSVGVGGFLEAPYIYRVDIPQEVTDIQQGDIITCTVSANDPRMVGRPFRVETASMGSHRTYRQLLVEDLTYGVKPED